MFPLLRVVRSFVLQVSRLVNLVVGVMELLVFKLLGLTGVGVGVGVGDGDGDGDGVAEDVGVGLGLGVGVDVGLDCEID